MFIQLGDCFFSVTEIVAIRMIGNGAAIDTKDGETYKVAEVTEEQWRNLSCCSSPYDWKPENCLTTVNEIYTLNKDSLKNSMWHDIESKYTICVEVKRDDIDDFLKEVEKRRPEIVYRDIGECTIKISPTQLAIIPETLTHDKTYFYFTGEEIVPFFELKDEILCKARLYEYYKEGK